MNTEKSTAKKLLNAQKLILKFCKIYKDGNHEIKTKEQRLDLIFKEIEIANNELKELFK